MDGALRWLRLRPTPGRVLLRDGLLATALVALDVLLNVLVRPDGRTADWWVVAGASAVCAASIVLRQVFLPLAVAVALVGGAALTLADYTLVTLVAVFILLTYTAAVRLTVRRSALVAALLWLPVLLIGIARPSNGAVGLSGASLAVANVLLVLVVALVCFLIGRVVSTRRAYTAALEERARAAESNQRALAEQAVADERRRIARELHDVVAHHVSVTGVLATGARRVLRRDPKAADEALATIEETSRTALREMRRLLTVLHSDAEPDVELAPQPDLAGIDALVDQIREAGVPVSLRVEGIPQALDPGIALTIYRIVQEALTNTLKHAGEATAEVRLVFGAQWLVLEVGDTGRGPSPGGNGAGHGLVGMRERVSLYGGTLRIGPRPGGGFRVYARIPIDALGSSSSVAAVTGAKAASREGTR